MRSSRRIFALGLAACTGIHLGAAAPALAFRNPEFFAASATGGGGGGKYFTVSRAEGYGCAVCHTRGEPVPVQVQNLPLSGFEPGALYRITIDWPDDMPSVALNVETTDFDGAPFGQLVAPDPLTLVPADLCLQSDEPSTGQFVSQDPSGRQVLLIAECGQAQTTFDWIAPNAPAQGYFSASITFSNRNGKLSGDQVVDLSKAFGTLGTREPAANSYRSQCGIVDLRATGTRAWNIFLLAASVLCARRLRRSDPKKNRRASDEK